MRRFIAYIEHFFTALFRYERQEQRGILLLVAMATSVLLSVALQPVEALDTVWFTEIDRLNDSLRADYFLKQAVLYSRTDSATNTAVRSFRGGIGPKLSVRIELNTADSARLTTVRGIGPVISRNIIRHRSRLGGFVRKSQLREVWGITDENFEAISAQFFIDTTVIQKINLNFASANSLRAHPCFTESMVGRILKERETKGGWNTLRELTDNDILLPDEAEKVAPYVVFSTH
jgi:DNA uptake protein ComE-like DNA-binding protein